MRYRAVLASVVAVLALLGVSMPTSTGRAAPGLASQAVGPFIGAWTDGSADDAAAVDRLGVGWGRVTVRWEYVEPVQGVYRWNGLDQAMAGMSGGGRRPVLGTIRDNPSWAAARSCQLLDEAERARFADFVALVVARYRDHIPDGPLAGQVTNAKYWQLYNESDGISKPDPNSCNGWATVDGSRPPQQGRDEYARMLEVVGQAIHRADPAAKVVLAGLASGNYMSSACPPPVCAFDRDFLRGVVSALTSRGTTDRLDVVSIHYFSGQAPYWQQYGGGTDLTARVLQTRQEMIDGGLAPSDVKPILVEEGSYTDIGGVSTNEPNDPFNRGQASYVPKALARAAHAGVLAYFWFWMRDLPPGPCSCTDVPFGLLDIHGREKPAFRAVHYFTTLVGRREQFVGQLTFASPKLEGYEFVLADGRRLQIIWNQADGATVAHNPPGIIRAVTDPVGAAVSWDRAVAVGAEPRFIAYTPAPPPIVAVTRSGTGRGAVFGSGISCGTVCGGAYVRGSHITLTAAPAQGADASTFAGWGGACAPAGLNPTCNLDIYQDETVIATFQWTPVGVSMGRLSLPGGEPALAVTFTARAGCGSFTQAQFGTPGAAFANAGVSITTPGGGPNGQATGFTYTPPAGTTSVSLTIQRVVQSGGATVSPILLVDGCGEWRTFVGGGPDAFR